MKFKIILNNLDGDLKEILHTSLFAFILKVIAAISVFLMNVVIARKLGVDQAGIFFLSLTLVSLLSVFCRFGFDQTIVKFVSAYIETGEHGKVKSIYIKTFMHSLLLSLIVLVTTFFYNSFIAEIIFKKNELKTVFGVVIWAVPFIVMFTIHAKVMQGYRKIPQAMFVVSICLPLSFLLFQFLVPSTLFGLSILYLGSACVTFTLSTILLLRSGEFVAAKLSTVSKNDIYKSSFPLFFATLSQQIMMWCPQLLLAATSFSSDVAIYNASHRTAMLVSFILIAVNSIAAPKFSALFKTKQYKRLRLTAFYTTRTLLLLSFIPLSILLFFPRQILGIFGESFSDGDIVLRIMALGQFVNIATGAVGILLTMAGHEKEVRNNALIAALCSIIFSFTLIPSLGLLGAAIATSLSIALLNILSLIKVKIRLGYWVFVKPT